MPSTDSSQLSVFTTLMGYKHIYTFINFYNMFINFYNTFIKVYVLHSLIKCVSVSCWKQQMWQICCKQSTVAISERRIYISREISRISFFSLMYGTILTFIKFNNFGTQRLNRPRHLFHSFATLPFLPIIYQYSCFFV